MTRPLLLNEIGRFIGPGGEVLRTTRTFVWGPDPDDPTSTHQVLVYRSVGGKAEVVHHGSFATFTRSRQSRSQPNAMLTSSGEQWESWREGCGCGNPIKSVTERRALADRGTLFTPEMA